MVQPAPTSSMRWWHHRRSRMARLMKLHALTYETKTSWMTERCYHLKTHYLAYWVTIPMFGLRHTIDSVEVPNWAPLQPCHASDVALGLHHAHGSIIMLDRAPLGFVLHIYCHACPTPHSLYHVFATELSRAQLQLASCLRSAMLDGEERRWMESLFHP